MQVPHYTNLFPVVQLIFVFFASVSLLCGCLQNGHAAWSPDGKTFAVSAADGLRLFNESGCLGPVIVKYPKYIEWSPAGDKLFVVVASDGYTWESIKPLVSEDVRNEICRASELLKRELLATKGNFDVCKKNLEAKRFNGDYAREAILYLKDTADKELTEALGREWTALDKPAVKMWSVHSYPFTGGKIGECQIVINTTSDIDSIRVSPKGDRVVLVDNAATSRLVLVAGRDDISILARRVSSQPDWSIDGKSIWFMRRKDDSEENRGSVSRVTPSAGRAPVIEDFADIHFEENGRIRALPEGRVLFNSSEKAAGRAITGQERRAETLMELNPGVSKPEYVAKQRRGDICAMCAFSLSPDKTRVSLPGPSGALDVLDLKTRKLTHVTKGDRSGYSLFTPCWKGNGQLCFTAARRGGDNKEEPDREVVLWSLADKKAIVLSDSWTATAVAGVLNKAEKESKAKALKDLVGDLSQMTPE